MALEGALPLLSGGRDPRAGVTVFERDDLGRTVAAEGVKVAEALDDRALPTEQ